MTSCLFHSSTGSPVSGLARFGATVTQHLGSFVLIGGVGRHALLSGSEDLLSFEIPSRGTDLERPSTHLPQAHILDPRPLLTGVSVLSRGCSLVITGGGAVCFSFGTYWNKGCYTIVFDLPSKYEVDYLSNGTTPFPMFQAWKYLETVNTAPPRILSSPINEHSSLSASNEVQVAHVMRVKITSPQQFGAILSAARPVILEGLNLGTCTEMWSSDYLMDRIGRTKQVSYAKREVPGCYFYTN